MTAPRILPARSPDTIRESVRVLRDGGVIAVPTDTVFGLVALYDIPEAIQDIFRIKGRPDDKPLPLLLGTASELPLITPNVPDVVWPLIEQVWPGPVTIIFESHPYILEALTGGTGTVGARVPASDPVLDILEALSLPLASTSANISGQPPATTVSEVFVRFGSDVSDQPRVDLIVDPLDAVGSGRPSTVVDLSGPTVLIRRRGSVTPAQIRDALNVRVDILPDA
jgi:L-threonylcarbamoyladenylate synthase